MNFINEKLESGEWRTIDKEQDFFLEILYIGDEEEPWKLSLKIGDQSLNIEAYCVITKTIPLDGMYPVSTSWTVSA